MKETVRKIKKTGVYCERQGTHIVKGRVRKIKKRRECIVKETVRKIKKTGVYCEREDTQNKKDGSVL